MSRIWGESLGSGRALTFLNEMLWNSLIVAGPILAATLLLGLAVSIFQATTQLQEMTLSFVPKILVTGLMLIALGPWMMGRITQFATSLYLLIPTLAE